MLKNQSAYLYLALLGALFFIPFLGKTPLFDWDEINFAESAREMILTQNYSRVQIDFKPFWEKPPLFFWLQVLAMKLFGINEFAARFPNALIGITTFLVVYWIGKREHSARFGLLWAMAFLGSFTPHLYFKSGIIDPTFNLFIFLSIYFFYCLSEKASTPKNALSAGLFAGLAILTKGPVGCLIIGLVMVVYWILCFRKTSLTNKKIRKTKLVGMISPLYHIPSLKHLFLAVFIAILVSFLWFGAEIWEHGWWFMQEFVSYQIRLFSTPDAGHKQPFYYHFVVVLLGCFPSSIFAFYKPQTSNNFRPLMLCVFWVVMILFSLVTTKIVHYSSMSYFSVTYLAAYFLNDWLDNRTIFSKTKQYAFLVIGLIWTLVLTALPLIGSFKNQLIPYIKDPFALENLQAEVSWSYEWLIGLLFGIAILWVFMGFRKQNHIKYIVGSFASVAVALFLYTALVLPKIERYTQGAAIDFYKNELGKDVCVYPIGFKSYAHLFYFSKKTNTCTYTTEEELLNAPISKPLYLVSKSDRAEAYLSHPNMELIYRKNGFVFMKRK